MARKRMISPCIWESFSFSELSDFSKLVFISLISHADDEGRGVAKAATIASMTFPNDENKRVADVKKALSEIALKTSTQLYKWDKSVLPNAFFIGVKNNYASKEITEFSLRRDVLSAIKTGVFQLPIAIVKVDKSGISEIIDLRETDSLYPVYQTPLLRNYPYKMEEADEAGGTEENGVLSAGITAETQPEGTNNETVATTKFGYQEILPEIEK